MSDRTRLAVLFLVMSVIVFTVTGAALGLLYMAAFREETARLVEAAQSQARLMEAVARFDHEYSVDYPGGEHAASIAQFKDAHQHYTGFGETGEFTVAYRSGDNIHFLFRHKYSQLEIPPQIPLDSALAEPMRLALSGKSGFIVGLDYRGVRVVAAYEPVALLDLGIVAKIDLAEVRAPFVRAGAWIIALALVLICGGAGLFLKLTNPLLRDLRDREERLALILASTYEGIFGVDSSGRCSFANRACATTLGYENEQELIGQDIHDLVHAGHLCAGRHPAELCPVRFSMVQPARVTLPEEKLCRSDGTCFAAKIRIAPMERDGQVVGTVVTFEDITQHKQQDAKLLQAQKLEVVGQLTGGVAHDFNNLLTVILGNLHFAIESTRDRELREPLEDALTAAQDGAALIDRLLVFARKQDLKPRTVQITEFLHGIAWLFQRTLGASIRVQIEAPDNAGSVRVDPHQLENAILNLAVNARDAMTGGGMLTIRAARTSRGNSNFGGWEASPSEWVLIQVIDDGVGMSPELAAKAVEPFFTTKEVGKGTGLGLSMAYGFAQQSGGHLSIDSEIGRGTTVEVRLPLTAADGDRPDAAPEVVAKLGGSEVVLVVEDQAHVLEFVRRSLAQLGYRVVRASSAEEAQRVLVTDRHVDLLFTDVVMPGSLDGYALGKWATQRRPDLKILLTTGFDTSPETRAESYGSCWPVLRKPYEHGQLSRMVREALDGVFSPDS